MVTAEARTIRRRVTWTRCVIMGVVVCLVTAGCAEMTIFDSVSLPRPFRRDPVVDLSRFGTPPAEEAERIVELATLAARMEPDRQQQMVDQLRAKLGQESDPLLRRALVRGLAKISHPSATTGLETAAQDSAKIVRFAVAQALQERGGQKSLEVLGRMASEDADLDIRLAAARSLTRMNDPAAVQALAVGLHDEDPAVQFRAMQSLKEVTGQDLGDDVLAWRQYMETQATQPDGKALLSQKPGPGWW